jgi:predicted enzyme related to lactoylglutathione lyase
MRRCACVAMTAARLFLSGVLLLPFAASGQTAPPAADAGVAVGPQYDSSHIYVSPNDLDAFTSSFAATLGGQASKPIVANSMPVPSTAEMQYVMSPAGTLSVFAFTTPIPFPFGQERTGYLVTDMAEALKQARADGAEVIVDTFKDPIGLDAVIQWPGGVKMQLYWHFTAPHYAPLATIPENRVYVSSDAADNFVGDFLRFSHGKVIADDAHADAGEIGRPGETFRRIRITSAFGNMLVLVTDGHLPYPFGHEVTGYEVQDAAATLAKAKAAGATILSPPYKTNDRTSAIVEFPGGYIAEIHSVAAQ